MQADGAKYHEIGVTSRGDGKRGLRVRSRAGYVLGSQAELTGQPSDVEALVWDYPALQQFLPVSLAR
jgi:hypothetical protein